MNKQNKKVTAYIMTLSLAIITLFSGSVAYAEETTETKQSCHKSRIRNHGQQSITA